MLHVRKTKSGRNMYPRRTSPERLGGDWGDPEESGFPTSASQPWEQREAVHMVRAHGRATVGRLFAFGDMGFDLRTDIEDAALLVRNAVTGVHTFLSRTTTPLFFRDQLPTHTVARTWNASEPHPKGSLPHVLGQQTSRALNVDTHAAFRKRSGNPDFRPEKNLRPRRLTKPLTRKPYFSP